MTGVLSDAEFLARSSHRPQILTALSEGAQERSALQDRTGVSRVTLSRSLDTMEEKGWVTHEGWQYSITPLGEIVTEQFSEFLKSLRTVQKLNAVIQWLPLNAIDAEVRCFSDAEVTVATPANALAPVLAFAEAVDTAGRSRVLTNILNPFLTMRHQESVDEDGQPFDIILSNDQYESIRSIPEIAETKRHNARYGDGRYHKYDGEIPFHLLLTEAVVGFLLSDDQDVPQAYVESQNVKVHAWAEETFTEYLQASTPISAGEFTGAG